MQKRFLIAAALVAAASFSMAQTVTVTPYQDRGEQPMIGTKNVGTPQANEAACVEALRAQVLKDKKTTLGKCKREKVYTLTYSAAPPPVTCPTPPGPTVATVACASPLVGTWQQTTTVSIGPAPTCTRTVALTPASAPAGACTTAPQNGPAIYVSDAGADTNPGTEAAPKRSLANVDVNALPAGARVLFKRGGTYRVSLLLLNQNVTAASPLTFDAYGTGDDPVLRTGGNFAFTFGTFSESTAPINDGGYVIRNLKLDGETGAGYGIHLRYDVHDVLIENVEVTRFEIGIHSQNTGPRGNVNLRIVNSNIHHNSGMGMLGDAIDLLIEGTTFAQNNFSGSTFNHGIYVSGKGRNGVIRGNTFDRNSVNSAGVCTGGNVTVHGQWDGLLIENNRILQANSAGGCYGISIVPGYNTAEWFRNVIVRGNTVENVGGCAICAGAAPGIVVDRNKVYHGTPTWLTGILIPTNVRAGDPMSIGDDTDRDSIVRDNVVCFTAPDSSQTGVNLNGVPGATSTGNTVLSGAAALSGACAR